MAKGPVNTQYGWEPIEAVLDASTLDQLRQEIGRERPSRTGASEQVLFGRALRLGSDTLLIEDSPAGAVHEVRLPPSPTQSPQESWRLLTRSFLSVKHWELVRAWLADPCAGTRKLCSIDDLDPYVQSVLTQPQDYAVSCYHPGLDPVRHGMTLHLPTKGLMLDADTEVEARLITFLLALNRPVHYVKPKRTLLLRIEDFVISIIHRIAARRTK